MGENQNNVLTNEEVTSHTADLWKYRKLPWDEPECHKEFETVHLINGQKQMLASRVRGKKHKHDGTNCDDYFAVADCEGIQIIVVCDGAGSKPYSRIGARIACETSVAYLEEQVHVFKQSPLYDHVSLEMTDQRFTEACGSLADAMQKSVVLAREAVELGFKERREKDEYMTAIGRPLEFLDFSATFLAAMVIPTDNGNQAEHLIVSCQIGDGAIVLVCDDAPFEQAIHVLNSADSGSYAGETEFITSQGMQEMSQLMRRTVITRKKISHLMVMSDGVAEDYYPGQHEFTRLFMDLVVNGVLVPNSEWSCKLKYKSAVKKLPLPVEYGWVNDPEVKIGLQYVNRILSKTKLTLQELWENKALLTEVEKGSCIQEDCEKQKDNLKIWLDNYVERGSFDDRTLAILIV